MVQDPPLNEVRSPDPGGWDHHLPQIILRGLWRGDRSGCGPLTSISVLRLILQQIPGDKPRVTIRLSSEGGNNNRRLHHRLSNLSMEEQNRREVELEDKPAAAAAAALIDVSSGLNCLLAASCLSPQLTTDTTAQARIWMCRAIRKRANSHLLCVCVCVVAVFAFCS